MTANHELKVLLLHLLEDLETNAPRIAPSPSPTSAPPAVRPIMLQFETGRGAARYRKQLVDVIADALDTIAIESIASVTARGTTTADAIAEAMDKWSSGSPPAKLPSRLRTASDGDRRAWISFASKQVAGVLERVFDEIMEGTNSPPTVATFGAIFARANGTGSPSAQHGGLVLRLIRSEWEPEESHILPVSVWSGVKRRRQGRALRTRRTDLHL